MIDLSFQCRRDYANNFNNSSHFYIITIVLYTRVHNGVERYKPMK